MVGDFQRPVFETVLVRELNSQRSGRALHPRSSASYVEVSFVPGLRWGIEETALASPSSCVEWCEFGKSDARLATATGVYSYDCGGHLALSYPLALDISLVAIGSGLTLQIMR